jgi:anti-sigma factor (TIGR02949 family)
MNCESVSRCLDAIVDGEADASASIEIERHLSGCPACREHLDFARAFRSHLRGALSEVKAPDALRDRVRGTLATERGGVFVLRGVDTSWRATALVAVAAVAIFALGQAVDERGDSLQASVAPILEDVVRVHSRSYPSEVASSEQLPSYFQEKVGFAVRPVDFADPSVRFVGARSTQVGGRGAATLEYETRGRRMTVVAFRPPAFAHEIGEPFEGQGHGLRYVRVHGHLVPLVEHEGVVYAVVGDMGAEEQLAFAARAALH